MVKTMLQAKGLIGVLALFGCTRAEYRQAAPTEVDHLIPALESQLAPDEMFTPEITAAGASLQIDELPGTGANYTVSATVKAHQWGWAALLRVQGEGVLGHLDISEGGSRRRFDGMYHQPIAMQAEGRFNSNLSLAHCRRQVQLSAVHRAANTVAGALGTFSVGIPVSGVPSLSWTPPVFGAPSASPPTLVVNPVQHVTCPAVPVPEFYLLVQGALQVNSGTSDSIPLADATNGVYLSVNHTGVPLGQLDSMRISRNGSPLGTVNATQWGGYLTQLGTYSFTMTRYDGHGSSTAATATLIVVADNCSGGGGEPASLTAPSSITSNPCPPGGGGGLDCSVAGACLICYDIDWFIVATGEYVGTTTQCYPYQT